MSKRLVRDQSWGEFEDAKRMVRTSAFVALMLRLDSKEHTEEFARKCFDEADAIADAYGYATPATEQNR